MKKVRMSKNEQLEWKVEVLTEAAIKRCFEK